MLVFVAPVLNFATKTRRSTMNGGDGRGPARGETRRKFLKKTGGLVAGGTLLGSPAFVLGAGSTVTIVLDPEDRTVTEGPVRWAVGQLQETLKARGLSSQVERPGQGPSPGDRILVARHASALARPALAGARTTVPEGPEVVAIVRQGADVLVSGTDAPGLVYGVLELADRVTHASDPAAGLRSAATVVQRPANPIRSITRLFTSEPEDKPWFNDRSFWERYLTMLARERFNRFSLAFGLGYNSPRNVPDSYFYFAYPFLFSVPGYQVVARGLPDAERDRNLAMLRWIGEQTKARGLHFQLALWTHAYQFVDSPDVNYAIDGLTPETHAAYCRDAVEKLLKEVPTIDGLTFRGHSESGIPEGSYDFWRALFEGVKRGGRRVEIDIHSKGIEHKLLDMALETGNPVNVSPKYWAEHMGLPYHQASIREMERARPSQPDARIEAVRRFTRYGYGDYLAEDRRYGVLWRMWPGTQRLLLWGDPAMAAGFGRFSHFCGSNGLELCEPLSFKGRMGSGSPGGREQYADASLRPAGGDWEKYLYGYRLWGRLLYDPETDPETWRRWLRSEFGAAASDCEEALARASRVLPLVTAAHHPSASNNRYWPEIYTDMPIATDKGHSYNDSPSPKRFGMASSLDPVLFSSVEELADELAKGRPSGRYSPLDVARWLDELARTAEEHLGRAQGRAKAKSPAFRRWAIDVKVQAGIGRYFAEKFRSAAAYALYERTADGAALERALKHHVAAQDAWQAIAAQASGVYVKDLTFGRDRYLRGHWADRLPAMEVDRAEMRKAKPAAVPAGGGGNGSGEAAALLAALSAVPAPRPRGQHTPPARFRRGQPLPLELSAGGVTSARLRYRHVNQSEEYRTAEMSADGGRFRSEIPGDYTDSRYPLLYFFELRDGSGRAWLYPGFEADLSNQPYFVVRSA
jgi:hypothetical protein